MLHRRVACCDLGMIWYILKYVTTYMYARVTMGRTKANSASQFTPSSYHVTIKCPGGCFAYYTYIRMYKKGM